MLTARGEDMDRIAVSRWRRRLPGEAFNRASLWLAFAPILRRLAQPPSREGPLE